MPDDKSIVPHSETPLNIPAELRFDRIRVIAADDSLPFRKKRELIQLEIKAIIDLRTKNIAAIERVEDARLQAKEKVAVETIALHRDRLLFQIQKDFNELLGTVTWT